MVEEVKGLSGKIEFQAVIMAGGAGSRMFPLTFDTPKPLLTIAARPVLAFQLEMLETAEFAGSRSACTAPCDLTARCVAEVLIITVATIAPQLRKVGTRNPSFRSSPRLALRFAQYVNDSYKGKMRVDFFVLDHHMGTADALRLAKDKIKASCCLVCAARFSRSPLCAVSWRLWCVAQTDFFVLSGDLVTNVHLQYLADIHRSKDAALTVLLKETGTRESSVLLAMALRCSPASPFGLHSRHTTVCSLCVVRMRCVCSQPRATPRTARSARRTRRAGAAWV